MSDTDLYMYEIDASNDALFNLHRKCCNPQMSSCVYIFNDFTLRKNLNESLTVDIYEFNLSNRSRYEYSVTDSDNIQ